MTPQAPEVTLRFYATLRAKAGCVETSCRAVKVRDVLEYLGHNFNGDFNRHLSWCHIFLNQDNVALLDGPNTRLKDGDILHLMPPTGGG